MSKIAYISKNPQVVAFAVTILLAAASIADCETVITVPGDYSTLSAAVAAVPHGGVIEIAAGSYSGGFSYNNLGKAFTIRAVSPNTVFLDGGGTQPVFRLQNTTVSAGGPIVFKNLVFRNGRSTTSGVGGGVTLSRADATFIDCSFLDNTSNAITGGGGVAVVTDSAAYFVRCLWQDNVATHEGAGLRVNDDALAVVHDSRFIDNSANPPNHRNTAAGGGVHVGNSMFRVSDSRFEGNTAGYVGGGIYAIGNWQEPVTTPRSVVVVANCTLEDNAAIADGSVDTPTPPEAGGIHVEDQSAVAIYGSRFVFNTAERGGAVNSYRAGIIIEDSIFRGNWVDGSSPSTGFGGAIAVTSSDTTIDGSTNRPNGTLTVSNTLIHGRFDPVGAVAQAGGGVYVAGDVNREYGFGGVSKLGPTSVNRSPVVLDNVVFYECDVNDPLTANKGLGGGMSFELGQLTGSDLLVIDSDATGVESTGGALRFVIESAGTVATSTFAANSAVRFGGAVFGQGSDLDFNQCTFLENEISPGTSETVGVSYGAALFLGPIVGYAGVDMPMDGAVENSIFADNIGLPIFDDDRSPSPINDMRYNGNDIHSSTFGTSVYIDSVVSGAKSVSQLNSLVVTRGGGTSTTKSQVDNNSLGTSPATATLLAVPSKILTRGAAGDPAGSTDSFLAWAWSGASATLNSSPLGSTTGIAGASAGTSTLNADGELAQAQVVAAAAPAVSLSAVPIAISSGQSASLQWNLTAGTYLDVDIDGGLRLSPGSKGSSGSVSVSPTVTTTYRIIATTEEGGAIAEATVWVDETPPSIFSDGFETGNTSTWSAAVGS